MKMDILNIRTGEKFKGEKGEELLSDYYWISPLIFNNNLTVNCFLVSREQFEKNYKLLTTNS